MNYKFIIFGLFCLISGLSGERSNTVENYKRDGENVTVVNENTSKGRSGRDLVYRGLIVCAFRYEPGCLMDVAQNYLDLKRNELLAEADEEVARASSSVNPVNKPSHVAQTIEKLFADLAGLFREGFSSMFGSKDDDDELANNKIKDAEDDDNDEDDEDKKDENTSRDVGGLCTIRQWGFRYY